MKIVLCLPVLLWSMCECMTVDAAQSATGKKTRRLIVNDDGEVRLPPDGEGWNRYLGERIRHAVGTQVDSYFLNIGATDRGPGIVHSLQSTMAYWAAKEEAPAVYDEATRRYIQTAREAGMEIFASIRMNDTHDARMPNVDGLNYPLKKGRPDLLLGNEDSMKRGRQAYPSDAVMLWFWPGLDWGKAEVREHFLGFIRWYCPRYDFDGLELDYYRHPLFFKLGEEEQHTAAMTDFVRQVRETLNEIGEKRDRPYLLAVRVPDTPAISRRSGLDAETWLRDGLMDLLIVGGGYMPYSGRLKQFVDLAHQHQVPAYPCVNHFRGPVQMRSLASNFWALGGDGFYLFNFFGVTGKEVNPGWGASDAISLREVGSVETLRNKDKLYLADTGETRHYIGYSNPESQFPVRIVGGRPVELVLGDDIDAAEEDNSLRELRLQFKVSSVAEQESISLQVNGITVPPDRITRTDESTFEAIPTASSLRRGINHIIFAPGKNSPGRLTSEVAGLSLSVRYE